MGRLPRGGVDRNKYTSRFSVNEAIVASLAGAWIETALNRRTSGVAVGRLPRGGVDRNRG